MNIYLAESSIPNIGYLGEVTQHLRHHYYGSISFCPVCHKGESPRPRYPYTLLPHDERDRLIGPSILISYYYYGKLRDIELDTLLAPYGEIMPAVFADSGAFSAYTQNDPIAVEKYADWLQRWEQYLTVYANLDAKESWRVGVKNLRYLEGRGLSPIPVFHVGEPFDLFEDLCQHYQWVAIGGMAGAPVENDVFIQHLVPIFRKAREYDTFLHGFGITDQQLLRLFPWDSVDSTSWSQGYRWGRIPIFDFMAGKLRRPTYRCE